LNIENKQNCLFVAPISGRKGVLHIVKYEDYSATITENVGVGFVKVLIIGDRSGTGLNLSPLVLVIFR